jgi:phage terminase large subunit
MQTSPVFLWNYQSDADIVINQGGTSSGKTYAILQVLFIRAINEPGVVITIAGQDMPNLRVGAIRDAQSIVADNEAIKMQVVSYNSTEKIYKFKNSSLIEFKSYDDWQDAKSGKRDYLFVNEANGLMSCRCVPGNRSLLTTTQMLHFGYMRNLCQ